VHSLLSGNLMDVCPVGAITTRDYRFKSRPLGQPDAVDTICTLCEKGCNTTAWIKAKPEWAKGAQLVRMTPRFNPDVNGYWMCDIGRFDYHWIEGDAGCTGRCARRGGRAGTDRLAARPREAADRSPPPGGPSALRFLVSAHASLEELFLIGRLGRRSATPEDGVAVAGARARSRSRRREVQDSAGRRAERQRRADLGFPVGRPRRGPTSRPSARRRAGRVAGAVRVRSRKRRGRSATCPGSSRRARRGAEAARRPGRPDDRLAPAADIVLPGASWVEKDASYVNDAGAAPGGRARDHAAGRRAGRLADPRERRRRSAWNQLHEQRGVRGTRGARSRLDAAETRDRYAGLASLAFARPVAARTGCRRRTRRSGGSGTSCSRTCRR
jgi:NADH-quinone oxidoreductase subunit G